ncbi:MAG: FAD-dependent oxidoreductase [bacterium]
MNSITRRQALKIFGAAALTASGLLPVTSAFASKKHRVVIIGGGIGGIATAKYLRIINKEVKITVIEPNAKYVFCPGSNIVLKDAPISDFTRTYDHTKNRYDFDIVTEKVSDINFSRKHLKTSDGSKIEYDSLVVSPGPQFKFDDIEGYSEELSKTKILHAWKAGTQTTMLRDQIHSMKKGGTLIIATPGMPFRCPPAPYERASFVAEWMSEHNPTGKIIILDKNVGFIFQDKYIDYWTKKRGYGTANSMIEWVSSTQGGSVKKVDAKKMTVTTASGETYKGDVINIIPTQRANALAYKTGLNQGKDWVEVNHHDMTSLAQPDVYVIGDTADFFVKTGYLASNQAKVVAQAIDDRLHGKEPGQPLYTNNCVANAGEDYGMAITDSFREKEGKLVLQQTVQMPTQEDIDNEFLHHIRATLSENWQRTFRRDIFD